MQILRLLIEWVKLTGELFCESFGLELRHNSVNLRNMKLSAYLIPVLLSGSLVVSSCQTANPYTGQSQISKTTIGAVAGGLLGAGVGALTGKNSKERRKRALIGMGVGVLGGGAVGAYMDRQETELRRELQGAGVGISRRGNEISLIMPGDITFATGSSQIEGRFYGTLDGVAKVLVKYDKTMIDVSGHTDSVGARDYNYRLSQQRAGSVAGYLQSRRINSARLQVVGYGPDQPVASNHTPEGRQANRRVTIQLAPLM